MRHRQSHYDVTNTVLISDPREVGREVGRLLRGLYPKASLSAVYRAFDTFTRIYAGTLPGYHGCDTLYHDAQHVLDCTLAMARLLDGHDRAVGSRSALGERRAQIGVICALFHDVGYIRREDEIQIQNGAELTPCHVTRSGEFLARFLPSVGFAREADMARHLVQFTGYEMPLDKVSVSGTKDRRLGFLLGTADLMAQMADREYPEKCRTFLYREFEACGLAGEPRPGRPTPIYSSPDDLLRKTPDFARKIFEDRLDGYFGGVYRHIEDHFGGENPYLAEIRRHIDYIRQAVETGNPEMLRRKPEAVNAAALRALMGINPGSPTPRGRTTARRIRRRARTVERAPV
ncbi:MAG TPA: HD domain-containing protein [Verrucomicrobiae bacterium]|nr:HD domain-containing protein [Verrucomicrobiae bacterium]